MLLGGFFYHTTRPRNRRQGARSRFDPRGSKTHRAAWFLSWVILMPRFRPRLTPPTPQPAAPDLLAVGQLIDELMQLGHFFVAPALHLHWHAARAEDVPWEVFRGQLLPAAQARRQARFLSWHVGEEGGEPILSVRLDVHAGVVHVTRGFLCHVWEGYDAGDNIIQSREVQCWTTELVGSAELDRFPDLDELRDELVCLIWQAIVGTSRLPLHSVEAPLPAFSLGQLHYFYRPWAADLDAPMRDWQTLLDAIERPDMSRRERARLLEAVLRHVVDPIPVAANLVASPNETMRLMRTMFNEVSLAPVTRFTDNARFFLALLQQNRRVSPSERFDFLAPLVPARPAPHRLRSGDFPPPWRELPRRVAA